MSRKYKNGKNVPTNVLCERIKDITNAITAGDGGKSLLRECTMRIPAEVDHDADLVLSEVSRRLIEAERNVSILRKAMVNLFKTDDEKVLQEIKNTVFDDKSLSHNDKAALLDAINTILITVGVFAFAITIVAAF
jgi:hypothetical protein